MSEEIKNYYRDRIKSRDPNDFSWQVGKTVSGKVVSDRQIELIVKNIATSLCLDKKDMVLDVGCANGMLTKKISEYVCKIRGVELTAELCEVAKEYNAASNISYITGDILNCDVVMNDEKYTKVYLYEVIQHLSYQQADVLFEKLKVITVDNVIILIGGILDIEKKWRFFDSEERRCNYFRGLLAGSDPLGSWYHKDFIKCLARKHGLFVDCYAQEDELYTSHYRFDCVLRKK